MKLCVKKIYCTNCQRMVGCREEKMKEGNIQVLCSRCGKPLHIWNGVTWRSV